MPLLYIINENNFTRRKCSHSHVGVDLFNYHKTFCLIAAKTLSLKNKVYLTTWIKKEKRKTEYRSIKFGKPENYFMQLKNCSLASYDPVPFLTIYNYWQICVTFVSIKRFYSPGWFGPAAGASACRQVLDLVPTRGTYKKTDFINLFLLLKNMFCFYT